MEKRRSERSSRPLDEFLNSGRISNVHRQLQSRMANKLDVLDVSFLARSPARLARDMELLRQRHIRVELGRELAYIILGLGSCSQDTDLEEHFSDESSYEIMNAHYLAAGNISALNLPVRKCSEALKVFKAVMKEYMQVHGSPLLDL